MNKYINVVNNEITDVFYDRQKNKVQKYSEEGTAIILEEVETADYKINGKFISEESGAFIFKYISGIITEKTSAEILADPKIKDALIEKLTMELTLTDIDIPRGVEDLMDALDANNVLKKDKTDQSFQDKLAYKKLKRAELVALINS